MQLFKLLIRITGRAFFGAECSSRVAGSGRSEEEVGGERGGGLPFLSVMTGRLVCLALNHPQLGDGGAQGLSRVKYLAGRNSRRIHRGASANVYLQLSGSFQQVC